MQCGICGNDSFTQHPVLWPELIKEWQLCEDEVSYVNRQQGEACNRCGSNLRSIALANALRSYLSTDLLLQDAVNTPQGQKLAILEINEAGNLTPVLRRFGKYTFGAYPQVDMHAIPYADATFDVVIHSDTLEHVQNPIHALRECKRVLKAGGALCFTVPIIVNRMSRDRHGLPPSYHGDPSTAANDLAVQTEFGADAWTYVMRAGFEEVAIHSVAFPAATAFLARKQRVA